MIYSAAHHSVPPETESVLQAMWEGRSLIVVNGPIGSGKSEIALRAAALGTLDGRVALISLDSYHSKNLFERFSSLFPRLFDSVSFVTPEDLFNEKWDLETPFSWMIIDDAEQLNDAIFSLISPLAYRFVFLASPLSLRQPLRTLFDLDASSVLQPCLTALSLRSWLEPHTVFLTRSHRLPQDSVDVLAPLLGGKIFGSSSAHPARAIELPSSFELRLDIDRAISLFSSGISLIGCSLPSVPFSHRIDISALGVASDIVSRLLTPGFRVVIAGVERTLVSSDFLVIVPDLVHRDIFSLRHPQIIVKTPDHVVSGYPITIVVDVDVYADVTSHAQALAKSLTSHYVGSFVIRRPFEKEDLISTDLALLRDRVWESFQFLRGLDVALSTTSRRIRVQERV